MHTRFWTGAVSSCKATLTVALSFPSLLSSAPASAPCVVAELQVDCACNVNTASDERSRKGNEKLMRDHIK